MVSIIVPCYNEEESIKIFYEETQKVVRDYEYEMIFIDDGSKDDSLKIMRELSKDDSNVYYISFSRNFGKEAAMYAGLRNSIGDYVTIMDADLQDPPELIPKMIEIIKSGYDSVATRRSDREGESYILSFFSKCFYRLINFMSDTDIVDGARDFRLMKRKMVNAVISMNEYNRFSKGIFEWVGFKTYWLSYNNIGRKKGKSKWNFISLFKYALDGIVAFSETPLLIASWFGLLMTFLSFASFVFIVLRRMIYGDPVAGWASTISIIVFIGGIQMLTIGIMGQYLAKIYTETKNRPHYIIAESNKKEASDAENEWSMRD